MTGLPDGRCGAMRGWIQRSTLLAVGFLFMGIGFGCFNVTLVSGEYGTVLLVGLAVTAVADVLLVILFGMGRIGWRIAAGVGMLPTILIIGDFLCRAPHVWGGG